MPNTTHRPYRKPEFLIEIYLFMQEYLSKHQRPPNNREMVSAGFASSTSVIRYYYGRMRDFSMLEIDDHVARGIRLLPLKNSHPIIRNLLPKGE